MALSLNDALSTGRRSRRRGRRRAALAEINVTPLVDVMLVLLIIFMVSAPLLTAGVPLNLPKTDAAAVNDQTQPITVSVKRDGEIYLGEEPVSLDALPDRVQAAGARAGPAAGGPAAGGQASESQGAAKPIFVRADGAAPYSVVAQVMARLSTSGFSAIDLITDTGGPTRRRAVADAP